MFEARIKNAIILKNMMFAIRDVFPSIKWLCSPDGISIISRDVNQITALRLRLNGDMFDDYRCDRNLSFAMKTKSLSKVLKYVTIEDKIRLEFGRKSDKIDVFVEPIDEIEWTQYVIYLFDYDIEEYIATEISGDQFGKSASIRMPSSKLQRICHDLSQIGDRIAIACNEFNDLQFYTTGEIGSGLVHIFPTFFVEDPNLEVSFDVKESVSNSFKLKILDQLTKATSLTPQVVINLRSNGPIELIYAIKSNNGPNSPPMAVLCFYLAPDVEIED